MSQDEIPQCPYCGMPIVIMTGGRCPSCGRNLQQGVNSDRPEQLLPADRVGEFWRELMNSTPRLVATPALVAANVLVFVAMLAAGENLMSPSVSFMIRWGANYGPKTLDGQWWRLVSSMFLHFGILHLGLNMWVLWNVGRLMERLVGNVGFLVLYFVAGIAGSLASLAWNPTVASAGASGAIFGVAGALLGFIALGRDSIPAAVLQPLRNSILAFVGYNVLFGAAIPNIDMADHLGGLAGGFLCGLVLSQPIGRETAGRRPLRNAILLLAAGVALPLATLALPPAPPDIQAELRRFTDVEKQSVDRYNELVGQVRQGKLSEVQFADALEHEVLPPWIESLQRIEKLYASPYGKRQGLAELLAYLRRYEEAWQAQVKALRAHDPEAFGKASAKMNAAPGL